VRGKDDGKKTPGAFLGLSVFQRNGKFRSVFAPKRPAPVK
jgi:hypothetical protein